MRKRITLYAPALIAALVLFALTPLGTRAQVSVLNYFDQADANGNNVLNLNGDGALKFAGKITDIDHGTKTLNGNGYGQVATNLSSPATCLATVKGGAAPGLDPVAVTVLFTTGTASIELFAWKATSNADPTLVSSQSATTVVSWVCFGT